MGRGLLAPFKREKSVTCANQPVTPTSSRMLREMEADDLLWQSRKQKEEESIFQSIKRSIVLLPKAASFLSVFNAFSEDKMRRHVCIRVL